MGSTIVDNDKICCVLMKPDCNCKFKCSQCTCADTLYIGGILCTSPCHAPITGFTTCIETLKFEQTTDCMSSSLKILFFPISLYYYGCSNICGFLTENSD